MNFLDHRQVLLEIAIDSVKKASKYISCYKESVIQLEDKVYNASLASRVVTEVDLASEKIILDNIEPISTALNIPVLSEEKDSIAIHINEIHTHRRFHSDCFWSIDPLDGTLSFLQGNEGYSVSIALVNRCGESVLGAVMNPLTGELIYAAKGLGIYKDDNQFNLFPCNNKTKLLVSADLSLFSHSAFPNFKVKLIEQVARLGFSEIIFKTGAGAVYNACDVLKGVSHCYLKLPTPVGGGCVWDYSATACFFNEAGYMFKNLLGSQLLFNNKNTLFMNEKGIVFSSRLDIYEAILKTYCLLMK